MKPIFCKTMSEVIVKTTNKTVLAICLFMACVFSFSSCDKGDDGSEGDSSATDFVYIVDAIPSVFSVEIKAKYISERFIKQVPGSVQPSEYGVFLSVDGTPSNDNYKYKISTRQLGIDNSTFTVKNYNLKSNTTYKYVAYVKVGETYYYGDVEEFATLKADLSVALSVGSITIFTLNAKVEVTGKNASNVNSFGVFYSENIDDVSNVDNLVNAQNTVGSNASDSIKVKGLSLNKKYYVVAYSKIGTEYFLSDVKNFTTKDFEFSSDAVDLGLSVKWASCNIGATRPEEFGKYLSWGETVEKSVYIDSTSVWSGKTITDLRRQGVVGNEFINMEYDPARLLLGGKWRLPRPLEIGELLDRCEFYKYTLNGVKGYLILGTNGNYIFLPATGYRYDDTLYQEGVYACGWGAEVLFENYEDEFFIYGNVLLIESDEPESRVQKYASLSYGFTVRPVQNSY